MFEVMFDELQAILASQSFWITFVVLAIIPYGMFVVARVWEGRRIGNGPSDIPLWRGQSKAFFPGDIGLALSITVAIYHRNQVGIPASFFSRWYVAFCVIAAVAMFVVSRRFFYSPRDYSARAWRSPSKIYHDFVMYLVYGFYMAYYAVPFYFFGDWGGAHFLSGLVGIFGLILWVAGMIYDVSSEEVPNDRQHPSEWRKS